MTDDEASRQPRKGIEVSTRAVVILRTVASVVGWSMVILVSMIVCVWLVGRIVNDRYAWSQWLWWIPTPAVLAACILGVLASLRPAKTIHRRRARLLRWIIGTAIVFAYWSMIEHHLFRSAPPVPEGSLSLVHWNMTGSLSGDQSAIEQLTNLNAVITVLTNPGKDAWQPDVINSLCAGRRPLHTGTMALLTPLPITKTKLLVQTQGISITFVELDATEALGRPIVIYLVDLPSDPKRGRMELARIAKRFLDDSGAPPPDLVVGDFNIPRGSSSINTMFPGLRYAYHDGGHTYGASYPRERPIYHIDHVLLGADLRCARYDLIDPGTSRHRIQSVYITTR